SLDGHYRATIELERRDELRRVPDYEPLNHYINSVEVMNEQYVERVVDLIDPSSNRIYNMRLDEARSRVLGGATDSVCEIDGSFALLAREGKTVRMARSLDRPMRYFLAKRQEGPALIVADRIDSIYQQLKREGLADQFHPSYTRMVPAHYVVEIQLVGSPDPDPT